MAVRSWIVAALMGLVVGISAAAPAWAKVDRPISEGRLDAFGAQGEALGSCSLKHTDVKVDVAGFIARVTVRQQFHNPFKDKVEAVYVFPLSQDAAVDANAGAARVFSFGIGTSVNRFLLDGIARAGRGEVHYVLDQQQTTGAAERFYERVRTPVLTDVELKFDGVEVNEVYPPRIPDLFAAKPMVVKGTYKAGGDGVITLKDTTGEGPFKRKINVTFPAERPEDEVLAPLWARAKVEHLMSKNLAGIQRGKPDPAIKEEILGLGLRFDLLTRFTSFVAVEHVKTTTDGQPRLVPVPVEMPRGVEYEGVFGRPDGATRHLPLYRKSASAFSLESNAGAAVGTPLYGRGALVRKYAGTKTSESPVAMHGALVWFAQHQRPDGGDLRGESKAYVWQAIATLALCEAYAMTHDNALLKPAQRGIDFIVATQHEQTGGWPSKPGRKVDTVVTVWQLLALKSAHLAYLDFPGETAKRAEKYLALAGHHDGSEYGLHGADDVDDTATAAALLGRTYLGWHHDLLQKTQARTLPPDSPLARGIDKLVQRGPSTDDALRNYFTTLLVRQIEGDAWRQWNPQNRDRLVKAQTRNSPDAGSWFDPQDVRAASGGRLWQTAMADLTLGVYFRHLPIYRKQAIEP